MRAVSRFLCKMLLWSGNLTILHNLHTAVKRAMPRPIRWRKCRIGFQCLSGKPVWLDSGVSPMLALK